MNVFRRTNQFLKCNLMVWRKRDSHVSSNRNGVAAMKRVSIAFALTLGIAFSAPLSVPALSDSASSNAAGQFRAAPPLQRGDLVRLRSGGPAMTVESVKGDLADCFWTDITGQINAESFPVDVLQKF
jgi:uncharacterized protein YodC (DUF2158 family)